MLVAVRLHLVVCALLSIDIIYAAMRKRYSDEERVGERGALLLFVGGGRLSVPMTDAGVQEMRRRRLKP